MVKVKSKSITAIIIGRIASIFLLLLIYPCIKGGDSILAVANIMIFGYWWFVRRLDE